MKKNIIIVDNGVNINELEKEIKKKSHIMIYTLDYDIHKILEKRKISHSLAEEVLTNEDFEKIDLLSIDVIKNCFEKYRNSLKVKDIFLPELIEHEFLTYSLTQFLKPYMILKIIENNDVENILDFTNYDDFIKKIIKKSKIKHKNFPVKKNSKLYHDTIQFTLKIGNIPLHIELSRKTFSKIKKIVQISIDKIFRLSPNENIKQNILLVNFDPLQYQNLLMELSNKKMNYMLLNTRKPAITNKKSMEIISKTGSKIIDLNKFSKLIKKEHTGEEEELRKNMSEIFSDDKYFEDIFSINGISFWYCMKNSFRITFVTRFIESLERIHLLNKFFELYDISTIFVWVDVGQEEKECILVGKKFNINSIMLQHGRIQTSKKWDKFARFLGQFPSPLLSDKQIVWGEISKKYALSYNHSEENIIIGGSPRHDQFFNYSSEKQNEGFILLATTGTMFLSADSCTASSQIKYDEYIKEIHRIVKLLPGKKLVIKSHPSQILRKFVQGIVNEIDPTITIIETMDNVELFSNCELLITFNNSTTTLEAMSVRTPVISLQTDRWAEEEDIAQSDAIISITEISECEDAIKKVLYNTQFRDELLEKSNEFLSQYMSNNGNASENIVNILKMQQKK